MISIGQWVTWRDAEKKKGWKVETFNGLSSHQVNLKEKSCMVFQVLIQGVCLGSRKKRRGVQEVIQHEHLSDQEE